MSKNKTEPRSTEKEDSPFFKSQVENEKNKEIEKVSTDELSTSNPDSQFNLNSEVSNPIVSIVSNIREILEPKYVAKAYEDRYALDNAGNSNYRKRFNSKRLVNQGEHQVLQNALDQSMPLIIAKSKKWDEEAIKNVKDNLSNHTKPIVINALDFGCGEGRSLDLWSKVASQLKMHGIALRVKAYDISKAGIESYEKTLQELSFKKIDDETLQKVYKEDITSSANEIEKKGVFKLDNLEFELLVGNPSITPEKLNEKLQSYDLSLSLILFGSTSHIFPKDVRNQVIRDILESTTGYMAATLPGYRDFSQSLKAKENRITKSLFEKAGLQEDEIIYHADDGKKDGTAEIELPYALYDHKGLVKLLKDSGAKDSKISVSSTYHPTKVSNSDYLTAVDSIISKISSFLLPLNPSTSIVNPSYYGVVASAYDKPINDKEAKKVFAGRGNAVESEKQKKDHAIEVERLVEKGDLLRGQKLKERISSKDGSGNSR